MTKENAEDPMHGAHDKFKEKLNKELEEAEKRLQKRRAQMKKTLSTSCPNEPSGIIAGDPKKVGPDFSDEE